MNISFEFLHPIYGVYKDTLCLPDDHEFTNNELEEMKQQRYDNWTNYIETSSAKQSIEEETQSVEQSIEEAPVEE